MTYAARDHEFGRVGGIAVTILAFILWWPLGLASIVFMLGRRRGWFGADGPGRWYSASTEQGRGGGPWNNGGWGGCGRGRRGRGAPPSGNAAFDEYRAETLRRLEDEQREFVDYLERLRRARDKAEFDQFMADRRRAPNGPDAPEAV
jgi:hypothetical protein